MRFRSFPAARSFSRSSARTRVKTSSLVAEIYAMNPTGRTSAVSPRTRRLTSLPRFRPTERPSHSIGPSALAPARSQLVDIDGSNERALTSRSFPSWSPDGQQLTFNAPGVGGRGRHLGHQRGRDGADEHHANHLGRARPDFSPNGQKIAYTSSRTGNPEIWVMNAGWHESGSDHESSDARSGTRLVAERAEDPVPVHARRPARGYVRRRHQGVQRLTASAGRDLDPNWSPTGQRIVFDGDRNFIAEQMRASLHHELGWLGPASDYIPSARGRTRGLGARAQQRVLTWVLRAS